MASIRFAVYEDGNRSMLGHRILPVAGIRPGMNFLRPIKLIWWECICQRILGYRHIMLRNAIGQPLGLAALFVKIDVRDFVSDAHRGKALQKTTKFNFYAPLFGTAHCTWYFLLSACFLSVSSDLVNALLDPISYTSKFQCAINGTLSVFLFALGSFNDLSVLVLSLSKVHLHF